MKHLYVFAALLLVAQVAQAQKGNISGFVVAAVDDSDQPVTEMPILVGGDELGVTGNDGILVLPIDTYGLGDPVSFVTDGKKIYVDKEGEDSCEDDEDRNADNDDEACVGLGVINWNPDGIEIHIGLDYSMTSLTPPGGNGRDDGMDGDDDGMDDDGEGGDYGVELGLGYNFDWGYGMVTIRGYARQPVEDIPLGASVGLDYMPGESNVSVINFMIDVIYGIELTEGVEGYIGGGLRFFRWSYSAGSFSSSTTETGLGLRGGATYPVGPVDLFGEAGISFAYGSSLPELRAGARYGF